MKVAELAGSKLDYWVARAENVPVRCMGDAYCKEPAGAHGAGSWSPSSDWAQGGPILDRHNIVVGRWKGLGYAATIDALPENTLEVTAFGSTYLEAAMRCCVASAFGAEVPDAIKST